MLLKSIQGTGLLRRKWWPDYTRMFTWTQMLTSYFFDCQYVIVLCIGVNKYKQGLEVDNKTPSHSPLGNW